jgi:hypothetical protein
MPLPQQRTRFGVASAALGDQADRDVNNKSNVAGGRRREQWSQVLDNLEGWAEPV